MDPVHRKIELQSLDDLKYLIDNVNQAAKERIVSAQKTSGARGQRQLKKKDIEELDAIVKTFIDKTFDSAAPNLIVNGLEYEALPPQLLSAPQQQQQQQQQQQRKVKPADADDTDDEFEAYDTQLAAKLQNLYAALESETLAVAELRRHAPVQAAHLLRAQLDQEYGVAGDAALIKDESHDAELDGKVLRDDGGGSTLRTGLEDLPSERRVEMARNWQAALDELSRLKVTLPSTTAKLERAKAAVEYLESREPSTG
ncbi:MAG: hypothetical protein M1815_005385 [Lichina confinis]|nr:MAG: hypothetical protein M1815_005385 [Lichina confinis]